jgi:hypothetical protein
LDEIRSGGRIIATARGESYSGKHTDTEDPTHYNLKTEVGAFQFGARMTPA